MCLTINKELTERYKNQESDTITCYKILYKDLTSPWVYFKYKEGWNSFDPNTKSYDYKKELAENALHVFLNLNEAQRTKDYLENYEPDEYTIFKIEARKEDLIAVGEFTINNCITAGFKKLFLKLEDEIK